MAVQRYPTPTRWENFSIKDPSQSQAQFLAGNIIQIASATLEEGVLSDVREDPKFRIRQAALRANSMILVQMDGSFPELLDPRVRQALSIAIDRDLLIKNLLRGNGIFEPTGMELPGPDWRLPQEELREVLGFNPQKAQELLDAAGADGIELPDFETPTYSLSQTFVALSEILQQM